MNTCIFGSPPRNIFMYKFSASRYGRASMNLTPWMWTHWVCLYQYVFLFVGPPPTNIFMYKFSASRYGRASMNSTPWMSLVLPIWIRMFFFSSPSRIYPCTNSQQAGTEEPSWIRLHELRHVGFAYMNTCIFFFGHRLEIHSCTNSQHAGTEEPPWIWLHGCEHIGFAYMNTSICFLWSPPRIYSYTNSQQAGTDEPSWICLYEFDHVGFACIYINIFFGHSLETRLCTKFRQADPQGRDEIPAWVWQQFFCLYIYVYVYVYILTCIYVHIYK